MRIIFYKELYRRGQVAQSVEQRTENPRVGGSIPSLATIDINMSKLPLYPVNNKDAFILS